MNVFAGLFVGVATLLLTIEGNAVEDDEHFIMLGPNGEVADENTPYVYFEDDYGVPQKAFLTRAPNETFAPIPPLLMRSTIRFHLYTRDTPDTHFGERLYVGEKHNLQSSSFNPRLPVKVLIHGFGNTIESDAIQNSMHAYMERGEYNVIGVDWGDHCPMPWYDTAQRNTIPVGEYVAELVRHLMDAAGVKSEDVHIIGHSLGAHVSGIAGYNLGQHKVARITGLDPAGVWYEEVPATEMLDRTDAEFVDVIHTCGGTGLTDLGLLEPCGVADFYPNGGGNPQPGCEEVWTLPRRKACSHTRAHELWAMSVRHPDEFPVVSCDSREEATNQQCHGDVRGTMGEDADLSMEGVYWLHTP